MPDRLQRFTMTGGGRNQLTSTARQNTTGCQIQGGRSFFVRMAEFPLAKIIKSPSADTYSPVRHKVHLKVPSASYRKYSNWNPSKTPEIHNSNPQKPTSSSRPTDPSPQQIILPHAVIISSCHNFFCKKLRLNLVYKINYFIFAITKRTDKSAQVGSLRQQNFKTT